MGIQMVSEASERSRQRITSFLEDNPKTFLSATTSSGWPVTYPMVARLGDCALEFSTYRKSAKVANVLRHGSASCLVVPRGRVLGAAMLWIAGPASVREPTYPSETTDGAAQDPPTGIRVPTHISEQVQDRLRSGKRCILAVKIERFMFGSILGGDADGG